MRTHLVVRAISVAFLVCAFGFALAPQIKAQEEDIY
jgi:hypothetical protein